MNLPDDPEFQRGLAARQIEQLERAVTGAQQTADLKAQIFQHPAHFAVLAFGDGHFDPQVAA